MLLLASADTPVVVQEKFVLLGLIVAGLPALFAALHYGRSFFLSFRRDPPDHERYATKAEVSVLESRVFRELSDIRAEAHAARASVTDNFKTTFSLIKSVQDDLSSIQRSLGRLEGADLKPKPRSPAEEP